MIDIHSHIIPNVDDGSQNMSTTIEMLKKAASSGTDKIIATPHFCRGYGECYYSEVKEKVKLLNEIAAKEKINIEIYHGQEIYYHDNILMDFKENIIGTINDTKYMLIELPMNDYSDNVFDVLYELKVRGIKLILAHPERYRFIIENPININRFINEDFLFQLNSGSISGVFGKHVKKTAEILLNNNVYDFIGSDAHNLNSRDTDMSSGLRIINSKNGQYINKFNENGMRLLKDEEIEFNGDIVSNKRSFFDFFKR